MLLLVLFLGEKERTGPASSRLTTTYSVRGLSVSSTDMEWKREVVTLHYYTKRVEQYIDSESPQEERNMMMTASSRSRGPFLQFKCRFRSQKLSSSQKCSTICVYVCTTRLPYIEPSYTHCVALLSSIIISIKWYLKANLSKVLLVEKENQSRTWNLLLC